MSITGVGPLRARNLIGRFGSPEAVLDASRSELLKVDSIGETTADSILQADKSAADKQLEKAEKIGASIITLWDKNYPPQLKEIYDPPIALFIKGDILEDDQQSVAIVGTRRPSNYGRVACRKIAGGLAARGITVVSGMARGIDSIAHRAALEAGGRTIAVLGSGLDVVYPPENDKLMAKIISQGAVISEFLFGTKPDPQNFPTRNRIISGMTLGTLVVDAAEKSGALITAAYAIDQNREAFAVPGNIDNPSSGGVNKLIKSGHAALITSEEDIINILKHKLKLKDVDHAEPEPELTGELLELYRLISHEPLYIDEIAKKMNRNMPETLTLLLQLEMSNYIRQIPGKKFVRY